MRGLGQLVVAWPVFTESVPVQQKWVRLPSAMSIQSFTRTHHFGKVEIKSVGEQPLKRRDVTGFSFAPQTPPAINVITPSAQLCWCVGVGSSAGGRVPQLTWTSWLLCTPSTGGEDSPRSSLPPAPAHLGAYRRWHEDVLPATPWWWIPWLHTGPCLTPGLDPAYTGSDLGKALSVSREPAAAQGFCCIRARLHHGDVALC